MTWHLPPSSARPLLATDPWYLWSGRLGTSGGPHLGAPVDLPGCHHAPLNPLSPVVVQGPTDCHRSTQMGPHGARHCPSRTHLAGTPCGSLWGQCPRGSPLRPLSSAGIPTWSPREAAPSGKGQSQLHAPARSLSPVPRESRARKLSVPGAEAQGAGCPQCAEPRGPALGPRASFPPPRPAPASPTSAPRGQPEPLYQGHVLRPSGHRPATPATLPVPGQTLPGTQYLAGPPRHRAPTALVCHCPGTKAGQTSRA